LVCYAVPPLTKGWIRLRGYSSIDLEKCLYPRDRHEALPPEKEEKPGKSYIPAISENFPGSKPAHLAGQSAGTFHPNAVAPRKNYLPG